MNIAKRELALVVLTAAALSTACGPAGRPAPEDAPQDGSAAAQADGATAEGAPATRVNVGTAADRPGDAAPVLRREEAAPASRVAGRMRPGPAARTSMLAAGAPAGSEHVRRWHSGIEREGYRHFGEQPVRSAAEHPVPTFSIDVDTASYANVRRLLGQGTLPPGDAVRVEELINYFDYAYAPPGAGDPFAVHTESGPSPWHPGRRLLHIGLEGRHTPRDALPPANLVFLVDVSGSMRSPDKLDLLKTSLRLLVEQLRAQDSVAIVVYAGAAGVVLEPTPGRERAKILAALKRLQAGGSTNGGAGIRLAYALARQAFVEDGVNRVILATDGDFNVGTVNHETLEDLVAAQRAQGVALTVLGFGTANYRDGLMQRLAQTGNGNAAYIDSLGEARKVLVEELAATLEIIASDVKIQVEFNPALVAEYRLIGYETRRLAREDFNNDRIDAGDIGAGHTVTALYELALAGGVHRAQLAAALLAAIRRLPPAQREALAMREEAGMSYAEIAAATEASVEGVKSRLRYAMKKLRSELAHHAEDV